MEAAIDQRSVSTGFEEFVAASSEHSGDELRDDDNDDLQLANVNEDQVRRGMFVQGLVVESWTTVRQASLGTSAVKPGSNDDWILCQCLASMGRTLLHKKLLCRLPQGLSRIWLKIAGRQLAPASLPVSKKHQGSRSNLPLTSFCKASCRYASQAVYAVTGACFVCLRC